MLSDELFLQAIRADPADDAPWLIYADWLDERGDPRAALYRHRRLTNAVGMRLVLVPRGTFWMGNRGSQTQVTIPHEFYIGVFPVTQGQWQAVMGYNPSSFSRDGGGTRAVEGISEADLNQFPVESMSWDEEQDFLGRLNAGETGSGFLYRLPAEAEWEYSCRGGASSQEECAFDYYLFQPSNDLSSERANFNGKYPAGNASRGRYLCRTSGVGSYAPNRLGIYDMHGNVWELCADHYYIEAGASSHVIRGGSWLDDGSSCRASFRLWEEPTNRSNLVGLRVVAVPFGE